jgi:hypothetical protein
VPPADAGGRDTNVVLVLCWSMTMPADGIRAATRERGLRYVAVFWQLAWSRGGAERWLQDERWLQEE